MFISANFTTKISVPTIYNPYYYYADTSGNIYVDKGWTAFFHGNSASNWFVGDGFTDRMWGYDGADGLYGGGGGGDDSLFGGDGKDFLYGADDDDRLYGQDDDDELFGGDGNDGLSGGVGNDLLYGGDDDDQLFDGEGDDIVYGGEGDDHFGADYTLGTDHFDGGAGSDTIDYLETQHNVTVNLTTGLGAGGAAGDTYQDVENINGTYFNDVLIGNTQSNEIWGYNGQDSIYLVGGTNNKAVGGKGADQLFASNGNDTFEFYIGDSTSEPGQTDVVHNYSNTEGNQDTLRFAADNWTTNIEFEIINYAGAASKLVRLVHYETEEEFHAVLLSNYTGSVDIEIW